jgi:hypothetical protein
VRISRASAAVSSTPARGQSRPLARQPLVRKPTSNGALCATSTQPLAKDRNAASAWRAAGAWLTMSCVIPVSLVMGSGTGQAGLTREKNSPVTRGPQSRTAPISMIVDSAGRKPVVSTSTTTASSPSTRPTPASRMSRSALVCPCWLALGWLAPFSGPIMSSR